MLKAALMSFALLGEAERLQISFSPEGVAHEEAWQVRGEICIDKQPYTMHDR